MVDMFTYFGSTLSRVVQIDREVNARIAKAFGRLHGSVWESLQRCGAANTIVCMRNVDTLPTARQKIEILPYKQLR